MNFAWLVSPFKWVFDAIREHREETHRLARFRGMSVTLGTETVYIAWDGPLAGLAEEPVPRRITPEQYAHLVERIRACANLQAEWENPAGPKGVIVYETDKKRWKKRLQGHAGREQYWVLKVFP